MGREKSLLVLAIALTVVLVGCSELSRYNIDPVFLGEGEEFAVGECESYTSGFVVDPAILVDANGDPTIIAQLKAELAATNYMGPIEDGTVCFARNIEAFYDDAYPARR